MVKIKSLMKNIKDHRSQFIVLLVAVLVLTTVAASKNQLDSRVRDLADYFSSVQNDPSKAVPAEILSKAEGLVIMRNYKAGFIVGVSGGRGVAIVKNKATGSWGPVAFLKAGEGSFGFQAGAQRSDMILVLMNKDALSLLTNPNLKLGVDIRATVGPKSAGDQANLKTDDTPVLVYGDTRGLFGGAAIETGGLFPDQGDNEDYYGQKLSTSDILTGGKVEPTPAAKQLAEKIDQFARPAVGAPGSATTGKTDGTATDKPKDPGTPDKNAVTPKTDTTPEK
jgi:SH3 domain-containing YSC84-like protein 1